MDDSINGFVGSFDRRKVLLGMGITAALTGSSAWAAMPDQVRIATFDETNPTAILEAQGTLDHDIGAKVMWKQMGSGGAMNALIATGSMDIGLGIGTAPTAAGLAQGIPYKCDNIAGAEEMTVRKAANIKNPSDFIGKTVATPFGSTSNFRLVGFLTVHKLLGKVKLIYMSPTDLVAASDVSEASAR